MEPVRQYMHPGKLRKHARLNDNIPALPVPFDIYVPRVWVPDSNSKTVSKYSISSQGTTSVARATISILLKGAIYGKNLIISAHLFHSTPAIL